MHLPQCTVNASKITCLTVQRARLSVRLLAHNDSLMPPLGAGRKPAQGTCTRGACAKGGTHLIPCHLHTFVRIERLIHCLHRSFAQQFFVLPTQTQHACHQTAAPVDGAQVGSHSFARGRCREGEAAPAGTVPADTFERLLASRSRRFGLPSSSLWRQLQTSLGPLPPSVFTAKSRTPSTHQAPKPKSPTVSFCLIADGC